MNLTRRTWLGQGLTTTLCWLGTGPAWAQGQGGATPPARSATALDLHALFERYWDQTARAYPEWATFRGDHRYGDRFTDASPEAETARDAQGERWLAEARAIPREPLTPVDRTSREIFIHRLAAEQRMLAFPGWRTLSLGSLWGAQTALADLLQAMPVDTEAQVEQLLARLAAYPLRMAQEIARLARGLSLGWVTPRPVLQRALAQIDGQLAPALRDGPYFAPFKRLGPAIPEARRAVLQAAGEAAIQAQVLPTMQRLRAFVVDRYLPAAPESGSLRDRPGGSALYAELVRQHTTTTLSPAQIHQTGLDELARLHREMDKVQAALNFTGSFSDFVAHLMRPAHFYPSPEAMLEGYRTTAKRLDPEMPKLFAELPRAPYGIRPMPAHLGPGAADNYSGPSDDGRQPGWYNANVLAFERRAKWALPTLVAHETVPGHHLQIGRARELGRLPAFRRNSGYTAFSEGWGLYAETLADEIGFYATPEDRFGYLQAQALRAARLVVDTGLHALGWSRQRAIDLMVAEVGESPVFITSEVDRYLSNPGQALAYKVGQLHILALRERARQALGPRFDLRRFNNAVIDQGSLPLDVLSQQLEDWITASG